MTSRKAQMEVAPKTEREPRITWTVPKGCEPLADTERFVGAFKVKSDSAPEGAGYVVAFDKAIAAWVCSCRGGIFYGKCKHLARYGRTPMRADVLGDPKDKRTIEEVKATLNALQSQNDVACATGVLQQSMPGRSAAEAERLAAQLKGEAVVSAWSDTAVKVLADRSVGAGVAKRLQMATDLLTRLQPSAGGVCRYYLDAGQAVGGTFYGPGECNVPLEIAIRFLLDGWGRPYSEQLQAQLAQPTSPAKGQPARKVYRAVQYGSVLRRDGTWASFIAGDEINEVAVVPDQLAKLVKSGVVKVEESRTLARPSLPPAIVFAEAVQPTVLDTNDSGKGVALDAGEITRVTRGAPDVEDGLKAGRLTLVPGGTLLGADERGRSGIYRRANAYTRPVGIVDDDGTGRLDTMLDISVMGELDKPTRYAVIGRNTPGSSVPLPVSGNNVYPVVDFPLSSAQAALFGTAPQGPDAVFGSGITTTFAPPPSTAKPIPPKAAEAFVKPVRKLRDR